MTKTLKKGDKVSWQSSGGKSVGKVVKKVTKTTKVKSFKVKASLSEPKYEVESDKSHKRAIHKAGSLKKTK